MKPHEADHLPGCLLDHDYLFILVFYQFEQMGKDNIHNWCFGINSINFIFALNYKR